MEPDIGVSFLLDFSWRLALIALKWQTFAETGDGMQVTPLIHGYGPHDDFCRRSQAVACE